MTQRDASMEDILLDAKRHRAMLDWESKWYRIAVYWPAIVQVLVRLVVPISWYISLPATLAVSLSCWLFVRWVAGRRWAMLEAESRLLGGVFYQ